MTTWVLFAGLPGTGKSTLAAALSERLGAAILDKDRVRAALFPAPFIDYSEQQAQLCLQAMLQAAAYLTVRDRPGPGYVFFDGRTFSRRTQIDEVTAAAARSGAQWRILHVVCEDAVAEQRLARHDPNHPAQNRDPALYRAIQSQFEPLVVPNLRVDTTLGAAGQLEAIEAYLRSG